MAPSQHWLSHPGVAILDQEEGLVGRKHLWEQYPGGVNDIFGAFSLVPVF